MKHLFRNSAIWDWRSKGLKAKRIRGARISESWRGMEIEGRHRLRLAWKSAAERPYDSSRAFQGPEQEGRQICRRGQRRVKSSVTAVTRTDGRWFFPALKGRAKIIGRCRGRVRSKKYAALGVTAGFLRTTVKLAHNMRYESSICVFRSAGRRDDQCRKLFVPAALPCVVFAEH